MPPGNFEHFTIRTKFRQPSTYFPKIFSKLFSKFPNFTSNLPRNLVKILLIYSVLMTEIFSIKRSIHTQFNCAVCLRTRLSKKLQLSEQPIHAQFNCTVCLSTKLRKNCTVIWTEGGTLLIIQLRQILVTLNEEQKRIFSCSFRHKRGWLAYDQSRHLIRTDLTKRLTEVTAQFVGEN